MNGFTTRKVKKKTNLWGHRPDVNGLNNTTFCFRSSIFFSWRHNAKRSKVGEKMLASTEIYFIECLVAYAISRYENKSVKIKYRKTLYLASALSALIAM